MIGNHGLIHESRPGVPYAVVVRQFGRWEAIRREGINAHPVHFAPEGFNTARTSEECIAILKTLGYDAEYRNQFR